MDDLNTHYPLPKDDADTPEKATAKIRSDAKENIYVFKDGKQVLRFRGEVNYVSIPAKLVYMNRMKDSIIVHNHPGGSSFSEDDVAAIIAVDALKIILVTEKYIYSVTRPKSGWAFTLDNPVVKNHLEECRAMAENELDKMVANNEMKLYEFETEIFHYIWSVFFRMNGIRYERKKQG